MVCMQNRVAAACPSGFVGCRRPGGHLGSASLWRTLAHQTPRHPKARQLQRSGVAASVSPIASAAEPATVPEGEPGTKPGRKLVFAVDGTQPCQQALSWVARNLLQKGDTVYLAHIICDTRTPSTAVGSMDSVGAMQFAPARDEARFAKQHLSRLEQEAAAMLQNRFAPELALAPPGVTHEPLLLRLKLHKSAGGIAEALCTKAADLGADLVLIASHGAGVLADYGSVARWCSENSRVPTLLLPPSTEDPSTLGSPTSSSLVVAGVDNLEGLRVAFDFTLRTLARAGDSLYVLHALPEGSEDAAVAARKQLVSAVGRWQEETAAAVAPAVNVACDALFIQPPGLAQGDEEDGAALQDGAGQQVCGYAAGLGARSVVLAHHGTSVQRELLYGAITLHVTKFCSQPLVVITPGLNA